jgi:hypothetical protein
MDPQALDLQFFSTDSFGHARLMLPQRDVGCPITYVLHAQIQKGPQLSAPQVLQQAGWRRRSSSR